MNSQNKIRLKRDSIKAIIFDFDGTLVDSMSAMEDMLVNMLVDRGKTPNEDLIHEIKPRGFRGGAAYLKEVYQIEEDEQEIFDYMTNFMYQIYQKIELKEAAFDFIESLIEKGIRIALASANQKKFVEAGLKATGIYDKFEYIITTEEINTDKNSAKIFEYLSEKMKLKPEEIIVFEDSALANKKAGEAGFMTVGVVEKIMTGDEKRDLLDSSDYLIADFSEIELV
ncbi:MAG: HAD family phosphatase [Tissierellia bacterium]|nr:HAD family phosphatase [Tissierellia bacterium]